MQLVLFLIFFLTLNDCFHGKVMLKNRLNCDDVECELTVNDCKKGAKFIRPIGGCCYECICQECPILNYDICTAGFKPVRQERGEDECCDSVVCISDPDAEELTINIKSFEKSSKNLLGDYDDNQIYHTFPVTQSSSGISSLAVSPKDINAFYPAHFEDPSSSDYSNSENLIGDIEDNFYADDNHDENILENDESETISNSCKNINCSDDKYKYPSSDNCPDDSLLVKLTSLEEKCCNVKHVCLCNKCESETRMNQMCKISGKANSFEAVLIQKGENIPGRCCDSYICHSNNFTCYLNGNYYPNNFEWNLNSCTTCKCEFGSIKCSKIQCEELDCEVKQSLVSECCPVCTGECRSSNGKLYKNNEAWKEDDDCVECRCVNGKKSCLAESCQPTLCKDPVKIDGVCCKVCQSNTTSLIHRSYLKYPPHCKPKLENFRCNLSCKHGFILDGNRCPKCECSDKPIEACSFSCDSDLAFMPLVNRLCKCFKHCKNKCDNLTCPNGFEKDSQGCDLCKCKEIPVSQPEFGCQNKETGVEIANGEIWYDGCRQCVCMNGTQYCSLIACQKLNCSNPVFHNGMCCPTCPKDNNEIESQVNITVCFSPKNGLIYFDNDIWQLDNCTKCTCRNGIVLCNTNRCPPVACKNPIFSNNSDSNQCCPYCPSDESKQSFNLIDSPLTLSTNKSLRVWSCFDMNDVNRPHGSKWKENECKHCTCINGESKCYNYENMCPKIKCKVSVFKKGRCCPYCLDSINPPYILSSEILNTSLTNFHSRNSKTAINGLIMFLLFAVAVLLFVIILLMTKLWSKSSNDSNCTLTSSTSLNQKPFNHMYLNRDFSNYQNINSVNKTCHERQEFRDRIGTNLTSPLLINSCNQANTIQFHNSPLNRNLEPLPTDPLNSDELSKSTLIACSTDGNTSKISTNIPVNLSKVNPINNIYYC